MVEDGRLKAASLHLGLLEKSADTRAVQMRLVEQEGWCTNTLTSLSCAAGILQTIQGVIRSVDKSYVHSFSHVSDSHVDVQRVDHPTVLANRQG